MRIHPVTNEMMMGLDVSSKLIAEWDFFCMLRDEGRRSAQSFLEAHAEDLGRRSTSISTSCWKVSEVTG